MDEGGSLRSPQSAVRAPLATLAAGRLLDPPRPKCVHSNGGPGDYISPVLADNLRVMGEPLMSFKSHIGGQNADVTVYPDRVEWARGRSWLAPAIVACFTAGISLLFYRGKRRSTEMFLTRSITSVATKPSVTQTAVAVTVSGNVLEFRCSASEAEQFMSYLLTYQN